MIFHLTCDIRILFQRIGRSAQTSLVSYTLLKNRIAILFFHFHVVFKTDLDLIIFKVDPLKTLSLL